MRSSEAICISWLAAYNINQCFPGVPQELISSSSFELKTHSLYYYPLFLLDQSCYWFDSYFKPYEPYFKIRTDVKYYPQRLMSVGHGLYYWLQMSSWFVCNGFLNVNLENVLIFVICNTSGSLITVVTPFTVLNCYLIFLDGK